MKAVRQYAELPVYERTLAADASVAAEAFIENGIAFIPYDNSDELRLQEEFGRFISRKEEKGREAWAFPIFKRSDGTYDPDEGWLHHEGKRGKDEKDVWHWRPTLNDRLASRDVSVSELDRRFLNHSERVFNKHWNEVASIVAAIDSMHHYPFLLYDEMHRTLMQMVPTLDKDHVPTSLPVLRSLYYGPQARIGIGKPHVDRCATGFHVGGCGGKLIIRIGNALVDASPRKGEALFFRGEKLTLFAREKGVDLPAIEHAAFSDGEPRCATVSFWHVRRELYDATKVSWEGLV